MIVFLNSKQQSIQLLWNKAGKMWIIRMHAMKAVVADPTGAVGKDDGCSFLCELWVFVDTNIGLLIAWAYWELNPVAGLLYS